MATSKKKPASKKPAAKPVAKKSAAKPAALPFPKSDDALISAARALAAIDGEIAELESAIKKSKDHTAELTSKKKQLIADRERASLDVRLAGSGRVPVFPTEDRRATPDQVSDSNRKETPAVEIAEGDAVEPMTFLDAGVTIVVSPTAKGKFVVDKYSMTLDLIDTNAGQLKIDGKLARHFSTTDEARVFALEAVIEKLAKRKGDDQAVVDVIRSINDARRKFPGYENSADYDA